MNQKSNKNQSNSGAERVVLLGFMGAGKTTVAQKLAEKIGGTCFDLDEFIEARENRTIRQIVENLGEAVFREIETEALGEILRIKTACVVIALGGGAWTIAENRKLIKKHKCRAVWLDAPFELCWRRIGKLKNARPLAQNKKQARNLFEQRLSVYESAEIQIKVQPRRSASKLADEICLYIAAKQKND